MTVRAILELITWELVLMRAGQRCSCCSISTAHHPTSLQATEDARGGVHSNSFKLEQGCNGLQSVFCFWMITASYPPVYEVSSLCRNIWSFAADYFPFSCTVKAAHICSSRSLPTALAMVMLPLNACTPFRPRTCCALTRLLLCKP